MTRLQTRLQPTTVLAMGLLLGGVVLAPVQAQTLNQAPPRLIHGSEALQLAETSKEWAIRPADTANPLMESTDTAIQPSAPTSDARSSEIQNDGNIRYVSGGVGESERTELNALANEFNLHLMFATQGSGEYLSAVRVNILDARGQPVLAAQSKGPWFYVQLPPGDYRVEVSPSEGRTGLNQSQTKTVHLTGSGQSKLDFYWVKAN